MKKSIVSIAIALALFSSAYAAKPSAVTDLARISFQKEFHMVSDVNWTETSSFVLASFRMDKQMMYAYYDFNGNMLGVVHNITTSELPAMLNTDLKKHYSGYWVSELFQVSNESGTYYFIQLKNADETIVLSTQDSDSWHRYSMPKNASTSL